MEQTEKSKPNGTRIALWFIVFAVIIVGVFAMNRQKETETITLGAILPLTGSGADQAEWIRRGFDLVLDEINKNAQTSLSIAYEDSSGDTQKAISAYKKLRAQFQIPIVLTWSSGVGIALTPIVNQDKVVQMGVATAANAYSTANDFTFRNFSRAEDEAIFLSDAILHTLNSKDVAILKINNDYGKSSADSFKAEFLKNGGRVLAEETFAPNVSDFRTELTKLKALSPKLIYLAVYPKEGGLLLRQAKELGITARFIASVAILGGTDFFNTAGESAEGLLIATSIPVLSGTSDTSVRNFVKGYQAKYQEMPGAQHLYTARAYDALKIIVKAIDACGRDTECIKQDMLTVRDYNGASGIFSFDTNGDILADFNLQKIEKGQFVPFAN